jgi:DNA-directed RNA polymerase subunit RPC12/RpoP
MQTTSPPPPGAFSTSVTCRNCGAAFKVGNKFCVQCGTEGPLSAPPPAPAGINCSHCGTAVIEGGKFCINCGAQITHPAPVQTPLVCPRCRTAVKKGRKFCVNCGAPVIVDALTPVGTRAVCLRCGTELKPNTKFCTLCGARAADDQPRRPRASVPRVPVNPIEKWELPLVPMSVPPLPPTTGQVFAFDMTRLTTVSGSSVAAERPWQNLSASGQCWGFQDQTTNLAHQVIGKLNESGFSTQSGFGSMVARMIQGALLDKTIYRQVAADASLQTEAWKVMGLVIVLGTAGLYFFSLSFLGLMPIVSVGIIQLIAWVAKVWVVQVAASAWLQKQISFDQLFRPLAYAQSPAILQIIPTLSPVVGLWCVVTNTAAIRDVTGCDTSSAAILAVIGVIGVMIATSFAGPIVQIFL